MSEEALTLAYKYIAEQVKEIERLHSIIKEVREYIENNNIYGNKKIDDILEILDKENKDV